MDVAPKLLKPKMDDWNGPKHGHRSQICQIWGVCLGVQDHAIPKSLGFFKDLRQAGSGNVRGDM